LLTGCAGKKNIDDTSSTESENSNKDLNNHLSVQKKLYDCSNVMTRFNQPGIVAPSAPPKELAICKITSEVGCQCRYNQELNACCTKICKCKGYCNQNCKCKKLNHFCYASVKPEQVN
jgi:hypothetical protein